MCKRVVTVLILASVALPSQGAAQSTADPSAGRVSMTFDGGLAAGSPGAGPAIGLRLTVELNERLALDAAGTWAGRGSGSDAGSISASLLFNLTSRDRTAVPYVAFGVGWYRAMFDMGDRGVSGMMGSPWSGHAWDVSPMPMFYLRRMGTMQALPDRRWGIHAFGDPALAAGGGVRVNITEHVYVRPEARALVALAEGRSLTTGIVTIGLGYRF